MYSSLVEDLRSIPIIFVVYVLIWCEYMVVLGNAQPPCSYQDTVNLTNAKRLNNGSYIYGETIRIDADRIRLYDYMELFDGERIEVAAHYRGCLCDVYRCLKFCCHPTAELISNSSRDCMPIDLNGISSNNDDWQSSHLDYDPYISIILSNGSRTLIHSYDDVFVIEGVPCEYAYPLVPEESDQDKWDLFENGTLYRYYDKAYIDRRDYCMQPYQLESGNWVLNPMNCPINNAETSLPLRINSIAMAVSVPFIVLTILVYILVPKLCNLHGKCLICYLIALASGYTILSTITLSEIEFSNISCLILGYVAYYCFMAVFFWLSIISYDLWQNFRITGPLRLSQRRRYHMYSLYAWGCPLILTAIIALVESSNLDSAWKPGIGIEYCWLKTDDWSTMIYFFGINLLIIIINIFMFIFTIIKIVQIQKELNLAMDSGDKLRHLRTHRINVGLFLRLFIIMGISWLLDILSYLVGHNNSNSKYYIFYISDFMNAIQGVSIFILFVLKPTVWKLIKSRLSVAVNNRQQSTTTTQTRTAIMINIVTKPPSKTLSVQ